MLNQTNYIYTSLEGDSQYQDNLIPFINYQKPAPERGIDMLLAKYYGKPYQSEVLMAPPKKPVIPILKCKLEDATIMLITDGGLVPAGNPDLLPASNAGIFKEYSIKGKSSLLSSEYEISHQGYDFSYIQADPNRLLPVDLLREMEDEHIIGKLYDSFLTTSGVMTSTERSKKLAQKIAAYVDSLPVDAVILTSACGTSTRCGSIIALALEKKSIPVVQVTNLDQIARDNGVSRIAKGNNVCYPIGAPSLPRYFEYDFRRQMLIDIVQLLKEYPQ